MKTQAELREIAKASLDELHRPGFSDVREVLADYLRLTDPTPLTAEHCRAAGMEEYDDGFAVGYQSLGVDVRIMRTIESEFPTVGLLYAAQRQEETR